MVSPRDPTRRTAQIQSYGVPRLLFALLRARFTGTLELPQADPEGTRTVWFRGGSPVFTDWVSSPDVLGQVLLERSAIDGDTLSRALMRMASEGGKLGEILVASRALDARGRTEALREQCLRKLVATFAITGGEAAYTPGPHPLGDGDELAQVNVLELVRLGVARHYDLNRVRFEMGPAARERLMLMPAFGRYRIHFRFPPRDEPILRALSGGASLEQLILTASDPDTVAQVVHTLWSCQMLGSADAAHRAVAPKGASNTTASRGRATARPASSRRTAEPRSPGSPPGANDRKAASLTSPMGHESPRAPSAAPSEMAKLGSAETAAPTTAKTVAAPARGDDAGGFEEELATLEARIDEDAHAFALMGIEPTASRKDVRRAWTDLSRRFHPDGLKSRGLDHLRQRVERVFAALSEANLLLGDKEKREELRTLIESGGDKVKSSQTASAMARAAIESEMIAREADKYLAKGKMSEALERYDRALALNPDEPDLQAARLWAAHSVGGQDPAALRDAIAQLETITREFPNVARAHYFRGRLLLAAGNDHLALGAFEQALQADPRMVDAERQARAIRMRRNPPKDDKKAPQKKGLSRFFRR